MLSLYYHGKQNSDTPAPRESAKGLRILSKLSFDLSARPPDTTLAADAKSGREDTVSSSETNRVGADLR